MSFDDIEIDIIEEDLELEFPDLGIDLLVPVPPAPSTVGGEVDPADIAAAVEQYFIDNPNNSIIPVPAVANLTGLVRPANDVALVGENKTFYISTGSGWNEWISFSGGGVDPAAVTALIEQYIEDHPYPDVSNLVETTDPRLSDARTPTAHTHEIEDVDGLTTELFNIFTALGTKLDGTEVGGLISTAIDALIDGAPGAVDTFLEVSQLLADHDDEFAALLTAVNSKVSAADLATALAGKANTSHTHSLAGLTDVDLTTDPPAQDDVLAWDATLQKFTPAGLSADPPEDPNAVVSTHDGSGAAHPDIRALTRATPRTPSGRWRFASGAFNTSNAVSAGTLWFTPVRLSDPETWDRIALYVVTGAASSTLGLAIYADDNGYPGTLVLDAGTAASTANATAVEIAISQALPAGLLWLASRNSHVITTVVYANNASYSEFSTVGHAGPAGTDGSLTRSGYSLAGAGGSFPSSAPTGMGWNRYAPAVSLRRA